MAVIAIWNADAQDGAPTSEDANVAAATLTWATLNSLTFETPGDGGSGYDFEMAPAATSLASAITNGENLEFGVSADATYTLNLSSLAFAAAKGGASSPRGWGVRSSVDSYAADISSREVTEVWPTWAAESVDLSGGSYQGLTTVTFRLYAYTPTGTTLGIDSITLNGTVSGSGSDRSFLVQFGVA